MKFAFIGFFLMAALVGCQSPSQEIKASVIIEGIAKTPETQIALQSFFHALEKSWAKAVNQSTDMKSENSELTLILIPTSNSQLQIKEIVSSSGNLSHQAGDAAVYSIQKVLSEFHFPEDIYREFVKLKEVTIHFKYEKPENGA